MSIKIGNLFLKFSVVFYFILFLINIYLLNKNLEVVSFYIKYFFVLQYFLIILLLFYLLLLKGKLILKFNYEFLMLMFWIYLTIHFLLDPFFENYFNMKYYIQNFIVLNSWIIIYFTVNSNLNYIRFILKIIKIISVFVIIYIVYLYFYGKGSHTSNQIFLLILSILLFKKFDFKNILIILFLIIVAIISNSRGTILDVMLLIIFRVFFKIVYKNFFIIIIVCFILIFLLLIYNFYISNYDLSFQSRILGLIALIDFYKQHCNLLNFIYGLGIGGGFIPSFDVGIKVWSDGVLRKLENTYALILMQLGIIGELLFIGIFIVFLKKVRTYMKYYKNNALYKGLFLFLLIEIITFFRVDATGDFLFLIPLIMIIFKIYFYRIIQGN